MENEIHWSVWLLSGIATGALPIFGANRMLGIVQAAVLVGAPFAIFMKAGAAWLPFALFFGGLLVASSLVYKLRRAREDKAVDASIMNKKRRLRR